MLLSLACFPALISRSNEAILCSSSTFLFVPHAAYTMSKTLAPYVIHDIPLYFILVSSYGKVSI